MSAPDQSGEREAVVDAWGNSGDEETCMTCDGSGMEYGETCVTCGGLGWTCWPVDGERGEHQPAPEVG